MVREKDFYKTLLVVAVPAALQGLISFGVNMLDNIMVGALGDVTLAAVSMGNQVTTLVTYFVKGVSGASALMISQYWGKRDILKIKSVFTLVIQMALAIMTVVTAVIFLFPAQTIRIFSPDQAVVQEGAKYIRILCLSYLVFVVSDVLVAMLRWVEVVRIGVVTSILSLFINLILNYILIFGKFGLPAMGAQGAALATLLTRIMELAIVLVYLFAIDKRLQMKLRDFFRFDKQMASDFFHYGCPILFGDFQWGLAGAVKGMLIGRLGVMMVAANSIADVILSLAMIFTQGLSSGACVIIGKTVGKGDYQKTREYSNTIQILFAIVGVSMAVAVILTRNIPPSFYNVTEETRRLAAAFLGIGGLTHIGTCYHAACFTGINRGSGDGKFVMKVDMICGWLIVIPITFLSGFVFKLPLPAVYLCSRVDQCFKWLIAFLRLRGNKWIRNVTRA